jgi:hypothetical protein
MIASGAAQAQQLQPTAAVDYRLARRKGKF